MTARHYYRDTDGTLIEMTDRIKIGTWSVEQKADVGAVGRGQVTVDDPLGEIIIGGHRRWMIVEDEVLEPDDQVIFFGYTAGRDISRGPGERTGSARIWTINLDDANTVLTRRVMVGSDARRNAEKDTTRVDWLITTNEAGIIDDFRYVFESQSAQMDKVDYNGQPLISVLDDCAQPKGKNYWVDWFADVGQLGLWYGHPGLPDYESSIGLTNDLSEVDGDGIFAFLFDDTKLTSDPSRVYSGIYEPFDGGAVYEQRDATATEFARRDTSMPAANVKTAAKARKRVKRMLEDLHTEDLSITTAVIVPPTHVNKVRQGQLMPFRATHLPGFDVWQPLRVVGRTVKQLTPTEYRIDLELSGDDVLPASGSGSVRLYNPGNHFRVIAPEVQFDRTGDHPSAGRKPWPLTGPFEYIEGTYDGKQVWTGIRVTDDITADIYFSAGIVAVVNGPATSHIQILVNGSLVGENTFSTTGGLRFFLGDVPVTASDVELSEDDVVTVRLYIDGDIAGSPPAGLVPGGTGYPSEYLQITAS